LILSKDLICFYLILAKFLKRKFYSNIRSKIPYHYLIQPIPSKNLKIIRKLSKKYPYFLYFDIHTYYPSINHQILLKKITETYRRISNELISRNFKKYLKKDIPIFSDNIPFNKGLSIGSF